MKEKDFDKIFSDKLKEDRHFPFEENQWESLEKRLNDSDSYKTVLEKNNRKYWTWLAPILLLFLLGNIWSLIKMNTTQKQNENLISQLNDLKSLLKNKELIETKPYVDFTKDTVIVYKTIYTDRIVYKDGGIYSNNISKIAKANTVIPTPSVFATPKVEKTLLSEEPSSVQGIHISKNEVKRDQHESTGVKQLAVTHHLTQLPLPLSATSTTPKGILVFLKEAKSNIIIPLKNVPQKRFYIGLNGGTIYYHTQWFNKDNIELSKIEKSYQVGIKAEFALNNNWRIMADGNFCPYDFKITWRDARYNLSPMPNYFNPAKHNMNAITGTQKMYLGSLGMKYIWDAKYVRPFLGVSYASMRINPYNCTYTYTDNTTWKTYITETSLVNPIHVYNISLLQGGLEYAFGKHLTLQGEGFYYKDMNNTAKTFDLFGLRAAMLWGF